MINLGDEVKDSITGFQGVAVACTTWLHGCRGITVQPTKLDKDGKTKETQTFDEPQMVVVKAKRAAVGSRKTGGPRPEPSSKTGPVR